MLFGHEHVQRYLETGGEEGHDWEGTTVLILTTTGRKSGEQRSTPLIYQPRGDDYLVVASKGGADEPPSWYGNLEEQPEVTVQVKDDRSPPWPELPRPTRSPGCGAAWPAYEEYQQQTNREIPVVVLERA